MSVGEGGHPDLQRARQAPLRIRVDDPSLRSPGDRRSMAGASRPSTTTTSPRPASASRVQDVLQDRPAGQRREELAAAEPRSGARREDERAGRPGGRAADGKVRLGRRRRRRRPARASGRRNRRSARPRSRPGSPAPSRPAPGRPGPGRPVRAAGPGRPALTPAASSRARRSAWVLREPTAPT